MDLDEKLKKSQRLEKKRSYYIIEYFYRVLIIQRYILLPLAKTSIKPNHITIMAGIFAFLSFVMIFYHSIILAGILYLLYDFLDHIDGMLARYKNLSSKWGHFLDVFVDTLAFNGVFIMVCFSFDVSIYCVIFVLCAMNLHGLICSFYIVERLKLLKNIQRFGIKKFFLDRGFILGIDASLFSVLVALSLFSGYFEFFFYLIGGIYVFDVIYRAIELKKNERLNND